MDPRQNDVGVTPSTAAIPAAAPAYSADERAGTLAVADRNSGQILIVEGQAVVARVPARSTPDYVRFVPGTEELWVTEPRQRSIEIVRIPQGDPMRSQAVASVALPSGGEGLAIDRTRGRAYTHSERGEVLVVDLASRRLVARWPIGCPRTHGIPAFDEARGLLLAGCAGDGEGVVLDVNRDGRMVGRHRSGGGEALLGSSSTTRRFYLRGDPGDDIAVLAASSDGLEAVASMRSPRKGHCLATDDRGQLWTCDSASGGLVVFRDPT